MMHVVLVGVLCSILRDVGILDMAMVIEAMGLRSADASRPSDVVALDFSAGGRHIGVDAVVTTVYRNTVIRRVAFIPGYDAKQTIDRKILADGTSAEPIASIIVGPHVLIPFAIKDGGRLGAHALALLRRWRLLP